MTKICRSCLQELPLEEFAPYRKSNPDLRRNFCRGCNAVAAMLWRESNLERHRGNTAKWRAARPGYNQEYYQANKEHILVRCAARREAKRDEIRAYLRQHYLLNPDMYRMRSAAYRARKRAATVEVFTYPELLDYWTARGFVIDACFYCGGPFQHVDHVIPLSRGGTHERVNLVPSCQPCNDSKGTKTPEEWLGINAEKASGTTPSHD